MISREEAIRLSNENRVKAENECIEDVFKKLCVNFEEHIKETIASGGTVVKYSIFYNDKSTFSGICIHNFQEVSSKAIDKFKNYLSTFGYNKVESHFNTYYTTWSWSISVYLI